MPHGWHLTIWGQGARSTRIFLTTPGAVGPDTAKSFLFKLSARLKPDALKIFESGEMFDDDYIFLNRAIGKRDRRGLPEHRPLKFRGTVHYRDVFEELHSANWCWAYDPASIYPQPCERDDNEEMLAFEKLPESTRRQ